MRSAIQPSTILNLAHIVTDRIEASPGAPRTAPSPRSIEDVCEQVAAQGNPMPNFCRTLTTAPVPMVKMWKVRVTIT